MQLLRKTDVIPNFNMFSFDYTSMFKIYFQYGGIMKELHVMIYIWNSPLFLSIYVMQT